jgi:hypothetical protein
MPFQSEKQRRFLHANHPEIAKRWEKEYSHGGILDINESEEITTEEGNDISLVDETETGVSTLFRAKDGGTPRRRYFTGAYGGGGADQDDKDSSSSSGGGHPHGGVASQYSGSTKTSSPSTDSGRTRIQEEKHKEFQKQQFQEATKGTLSDPEEKYDSWEQQFQDIPGDVDSKSPQHNPYKSKTHLDYKREAHKTALATQKQKMIKMGLGKLIMPAIMIAFGVPPSVALKSITVNPKDMMTAVKHSLPVVAAKKELMEALENYKGGLLKNVDTTNPNEMVNLEETTDFTEIMNEIKDLTTTPEDDDTKGDGPEVPQVVPIGEEIQEYEDTYAMSPWDRIKANQAKRAMLVEKGVIQENPIVDESVTDITMQANSGGLANLFRVKNQ